MLLHGTRIMLSDMEPTVPAQRPSYLPLSLVVTMDTKEQVMQAFEAMKDGAEILSPPQSTTYSSCFLSLIDRFGNRWEIMTEQTLC